MTANTTTISFEIKKKLKERIEKISDKKELEKIRDIIFRCNPDISVSQNSSGMLLFFHNLTDITYTKITHFLNKLDASKIKSITQSSTEDDIDTNYVNKLVKDSIGNSLKLNSLEKNLIKKKDYYDKLNIENEVNKNVIYRQDTDIFMDKDNNTDNADKKKRVNIKIK